MSHVSYSDLQAEIDELEERASGLEAHNDLLFAENNQLREQIEKLEKQVLQLKERERALQSALDKSNNRLKQMAGDMLRSANVKLGPIASAHCPKA